MHLKYMLLLERATSRVRKKSDSMYSQLCLLKSYKLAAPIIKTLKSILILEQQQFYQNGCYAIYD